jgi:hypothetical protein
MIAVAVVGLLLGAIMTAPWLILLILITSPQTIVVALCAYQAIREGAGLPTGDQPVGSMPPPFE